MDAFFENIDKDLRVSVFRNVEHTWPTHFHGNLEIFIVRRGRYEITRNGENFELTNGSIAFFDHYDLHSYVNKGGDDDCVIMIPVDVSKAFDTARKNKFVKNAVIRDAALVEEILDAIDCVNLSRDDDYFVNSTVNYILCKLYKVLDFADAPSGAQSDPEYMRRMLIYIAEHFRGDITATSLASQMGYSREYVSRLFNRYMKESIPSYINKRRAQYVKEQKETSEKSLTEIILDAGFKHTSSYYRFINNQKELF